VQGDEQIMRLMRMVRDTEDPAEPLRDLRRWQIGAELDAATARKYARRFIRKDDDLALAAQVAVLGPREDQLVEHDELVRLTSHDSPAI
jgi:hypothetical protein